MIATHVAHGMKSPPFVRWLACWLMLSSCVAIASAADPPPPNAPPKLTAAQQARLEEAKKLNDQVVRLFNQRRYRDALPLAKKVLEVRLEILGEKHIDTAIALNNVGAQLKALRDFPAARPYLERALTIRKEILGEKHPDTAFSLNYLGSLLQAMGDNAAARPYLEQALAIKKEVRGPKHLDTALSLNNLGTLLYAMGDYAAARPYYEQALRINKEVRGEKHPATATLLNNLGTLLYAMGDYVAARPYLEQSLAIRKEVLGEKHSDTAQSLNNLGSLLDATGDYAAARRSLEQSLAIRKEVLGEKHPDTALSLSTLGSLLDATGDYAAARPYLEQALAINKEVLGAKHPETALSLNYLGNLLYAMGDYTAAHPYYELALRINKEVLGEKHPNTAQSLNNLGSLLDATGHYAAARRSFEQSLAIRKEVLGEKHPDTAQSLNNLGVLLQATGDYTTARPYLEQALAINKEVRGERHPGTATSLNNLGLLLQAMGDYAAARPHFEQSLAIRKEVLGEKHPDTAGSLNNLGMLLQAMGDYAAARSYYEQALPICKEVLGEKHPETASSLIYLGSLLDAMGDYTAARPYYEQALAIRKEVLGEKHPETASSLNSLGLLLHAIGDYATARPYLEQALAIKKEVLGEKHPETAILANNLGLLLHALGDNTAARPYLEQSMAIRKEALGDKHPATALGLYNLAALEGAAGHWEVASELEDHSRRIVRRHVARVLPGQSEREQLTFLQRMDGGPFHISLTLGVQQRAEPRIAALSAAWLINGKAVAQESLIERVLMARESKDPALTKTVDDLQMVRRQLAGLALAAPKPGQEQARQQAIERLEKQEQELSRRLGSATDREVRAEPWIELATVREKLPADAVLLDIARFSVYDFAAKGKEKPWKPAHYAVWITPPAGKGQTQIVDLGEVEPIDAAVQTVRQGLQYALGSQGINARGDREAEQTLRGALQTLAKLIWRPLVPAVGDAKQLFLSPDSALWLAPWGALPVDDRQYLIEKYVVHYLVSGRDLGPASNAKWPLAGPVIMADPDFDLAPDLVAAAAQAILSKPAADESLAVRSPGSAGRLGKVNRLPGTAAEAKAVAPSLRQYAGQEPTVYTGHLASEIVYKSLVRPRALIVSTHGYFLPDQEVKLDEFPGMDRGIGAVVTSSKDHLSLPPPLDREGKPLENPLLRCGLLLAGCNQRPEQNQIEDDGVLTGMEIVGTDLRGTELVVLSACETGLGQVRNGEGVAGLRQAFQLAGAKAVVASLWKIPDQETTWLMTRFWENLAAGMNKANALRDAQLMMLYHGDELRTLAAKGKRTEVDQILAQRGVDFGNPTPLPKGGKPVPPAGAAKADTSGRCHPFYWAAFTLTGR